MNKLGVFFTLLILLFIFPACSDEDSDEVEVILPSNLVLSVEKDTLQDGLVRVRATADNVNFYTFIFNEPGNMATKEEASGQSEHTFLTSGEFTIEARAHTTSSEYISTSQKVVIYINLPGNNGNPPDSGYSTPLSYPTYTLVWNDEFDGNALNIADWNYEIGTGNNGWGNNELQFYRQENTSVSNGILTIEAKREFFSGSQFTSSRLTTKGKQSFQHGRIDIRAAMPFGQGIWPALWMLGNSIDNVGWPRCGEIDIMEMVGGNVPGGGDNVTHGTVHWANASGARELFGGKKTLANGTLADNWHVYSIIWDNQKIEWYLDDVRYNSIDVTPANLDELRNQKFFFIMNVAVGGDWPGSPDPSTVFPQKMFVDYIRVFQ